MEYEHVDGDDKGSIRLFALSTCGWCRKTKRLLDELGAAYDYVYVDHAHGQDRDVLIKAVEEWNPRCSFPTLVIHEKICIVGFKEEEIREALQ